ncbi:MAG: MFS transporter [Ruminococcaceae bacterium]|nr:MFS transporter [Oscillospiraceae bacterium]
MLNFKRTKLACYTAYFTMSSIFCVPPLLFMTFHTLYNISYTLLGTLVLTNFCTQMLVDLIFTLFSKKFNIQKVVRVMPCITSLGLFVYALVPNFFPQYAYIGLVLGTIIFSVSAGLSEVLLSPVIAAIPSDNPQKDMSMLHSLYAFGFFTMVVISTLFLKFFGNENWSYLVLLIGILPLLAAILFKISPFPDMTEEAAKEKNKEKNKNRTIGLALCVGCIFLGSCAENTMSNWISTYMENALNIDKALGDILGMAMFAILLGITRITYAKRGKNISKFLLISMLCAAICYLTISISNNTILSFIACILTGIFTAMLWPGTLILMEEKVKGVGVAAYALMASAGDFGASLAPQLMGIVIDNVSVSQFALNLSTTLNLTPEQIGLKVGMLITSVFPILGTILVAFIIKYFKKNKSQEL